MATKLMLTELLGMDGQPIKDSADRERSVTLRTVVVGALLMPDERASMAQKLDRAILADLCRRRGNPKLTSADVETIKEAVARFMPPIVLFRVCELLDPNSVEYREPGEDGEEAEA